MCIKNEILGAGLMEVTWKYLTEEPWIEITDGEI
jgi:hypothetical protein